MKNTTIDDTIVRRWRKKLILTEREYMKKALIVTTVSGFVPQFEMHNVHILQELGYEVHYASNFQNVSYGIDNHRLDGTGIVRHQVDLMRSPFDLKNNRKAYQQIKEILKAEDFDLLHCHTPVGAVLARLVAKSYRKKGMKVIYTAHGFHFYKGAPLKFWLVSYPIEWWLAKDTDSLITINEEDFKNAKKLPVGKKYGKKGNVYKIDSVGIDCEKYRLGLCSKEQKRKELGISKEAFVLISVGELNWNKNHAIVVEALGRLKELNLQYIICGEGIERVPLEKQAKQLGIIDKVILTGFRSDIPEILNASDAMIFPSLREGFGLAAVEAMATGIPVIAFDNRGTREYMQDGKNGYVVWDNDVEGMVNAIKRLYHLPKEEYEIMQQHCFKTAKRFDYHFVNKIMKKIYEE